MSDETKVVTPEPNSQVAEPIRSILNGFFALT